MGGSSPHEPSPPAPTHPQGGDLPPRSRRVSTASSSSLPSAVGSSGTPSHSEDLVETLYNHPSVKIIAFTSSQKFGPTPHEKDPQHGTLPASSRLERTLAVGPFRIYRAPGSVAFLSCGSALQPILPKSQCWCLDEDNGRFVLQIRRPQYWRIELPIDDPDDLHRALILREVLDSILLFEKTECPFQRSFTVELPESAHTPVKLKPWTPEGKNLISSPFSPLQSASPSPITRERRTTLSASNFVSEYELLGRDKKPKNEKRDFSISPTRSEPISILSAEELSEQLARYSRERVRLAEESDEHLDNNPKYPRSNIDIKPLQRPTDQPIGDDPATRRRPSTRNGTFRSSTGTLVEEAENYDQHIEMPPSKASTASPKARSGEIGNEPSSFEGSGHVAPVNLNRKRMSRVRAGRLFTAATHVSANTPSTSTPSKTTRPKDTPRETPRETPRATQSTRVTPTTPSQLHTTESSPGDSTDSFDSVQSWHTPLTPLPPSPPSSRPSTPPNTAFPRLRDGIVPGREAHSKDTSDFTPTQQRNETVNPSSARAVSNHRDASATRESNTNSHEKPTTPTSLEGEATAARSSALEERPPPPRPRVRPNSLSISRRALSPLPPAANLFSPPKKPSDESHLKTMRRLPSTIIQRTLEVLLGPPIYLVKLMLKVAAKILAGEWRGLVFGFGESGEQIPVQWDYSDGEFSDWEDDDTDEILFTGRRNNSGNSQPSNSSSGSKTSRDREVD
ncbi:hypothetical protein SLS62_005648 [Diatrype stigma]|uniref:Inheritance of peroxisomes protein 1 n=1 Tax=Diatrype stigma TaxID=117547 RepID=A0AAN9YRV6_9PEZI